MSETNLPLTPENLEDVSQEIGRRQKTAKEKIVKDWLPRYTGMPLDEFGEYVLLVNFANYVRVFAEHHNVQVYGADKPMQAATSEKHHHYKFRDRQP